MEDCRMLEWSKLDLSLAYLSNETFYINLFNAETTSLIIIHGHHMHDKYVKS